MNAPIILETRALTKEFKGFVAVSKVDLKVRRGSIHALIGPNGAGKTTCFNLLTKFLTPTSGSIHFDGADITAETPAHIARRGVIRSFQISSVFPHLTVLENVRIGLQRELGTSFHFWKSDRSLETLHTRAVPHASVPRLSAFFEAFHGSAANLVMFVALATAVHERLERGLSLAAGVEQIDVGFLTVIDVGGRQPGQQRLGSVDQTVQRIGHGRRVQQDGRARRSPASTPSLAAPLHPSCAHPSPLMAACQ